MKRFLRGLWARDEGQGLAEYTLLLCLLLLMGVATMRGMASRINNICFRTSSGMAMAAGHASLSAGPSDTAAQSNPSENSTNKNKSKLY